MTTKRVFMCTAGTCGLCGCAISEMPEAQKRGSSSAPGISLRNSGANSPCTVEQCTPTFSNTRPRIIAITPPPPGCRYGRCAARACARSGRPRVGQRRAGGQRVLERFERGADVVAQALEPGAGARSCGHRASRRRGGGGHRVDLSHRQRRSSAASPRPAPWRAAIATLSERKPGAHRDAQPRVGGLMDGVRHAGAIRGRTAGRRPAGRRDRDRSVGRAVVNSTSRRPSRPPPGLECRPGGMAAERHLIEIVHAGAAEGAVGDSGSRPAR